MTTNNIFAILVSHLGDEKATEIWNSAQDDISCGIFRTIEHAVRENLELQGITNIDFNVNVADLYTRVDPTLAKDSFVGGNSGNEDVRRDTSVSSDSAASLEVGDNLVKPSNVVNQTTQENNMSFAQFLADILFAGSTSSLRMDISETDKAAKAAEGAERRKAFLAAFGTKLHAPIEDTILVVKAKHGKKAVAGATGRVAQLFGAFNLVGVDQEGNPAEVRFCKQDCPAADAEVEGYALTNAYEFYARCLAYATKDLTPAEKSQFFALAFKGVGRRFKVSEDSVIFHDVEFDFAKGVVITRTQHKATNPSFLIDGHEFTGAHGVFLLALTCYGKSDKAVNTIVNNAVNLFKRNENYGAATDKADLAYNVYHNLQLPVKISKSHSSKFPFFTIASAKLNDEKLSEVLASGGMAIVDKYNMKWLAKGVAAEAVLVGRSGDTIINLNDANKPTKVYNRPASNKYLFAAVEGRCNSHFAVALSNGEKSYSAGAKLRTVWSNSRFGHGSGVSVINPEFGFNYTVAKSLKGVFNILTLPAAARAGKTYEEVSSVVCSHINAMILGCIGKSYEPGASIIELACAGTSKAIITNNQKGVALRVKGGRATISSAFEIDVKLDVEIVGTHEQYVKLRGIGKKATTLPYKVDGIDAPWDILLNIEAVKGWPALIEMYCNSFNKDCYYNSNTGILTTPEGEVDFTQTENAFTRWATETCKETVISFEMARSSYEDLRSVIDGYDDVEVVDNGDIDRVIIRERVQYIIGDVHFDVEVSTPKESISTTEFTLEAASGILIQDKALGEALMSGLVSKVSSTESLVNSFLTVGGKLPTFNVSTQAGRNGISRHISRGTGFANHRQILKELCKAFPNGLVIEYATRDGVKGFEVHPRALATFGGFTSNGSATREVAEVIDLVYFISDAIGGESSVDVAIVELCYNTARTLARWAENLVKSKSAMKKFTRSGKLLGGKVRTTYSPLTNNVNGLPVVVVNPNGPIARGLGLDRNTIFGQIVGITRTPMPFMTACFVRLDDACPVGHVLVSPKVWHAANEGK